MTSPAGHPDLAEARRHLRDRLQGLYGDRLCGAVLFRSYVHGEIASASDIEVLVILRGPVDRYAEHRRLGELVVEGLERFRLYVAYLVVSEEDYQDRDWPLLQSVREEGVPL